MYIILFMLYYLCYTVFIFQPYIFIYNLYLYLTYNAWHLCNKMPLRSATSVDADSIHNICESRGVHRPL